MKRTVPAIVLSLVVGGVSSLASAGGVKTDAHHTKTASHRLHVPVKRRVWVASRPADTAARVVTQWSGVHEDKSSTVLVRVVDTTICLDANTDYLRQGENRIDQNHFIPAAQRLHHSLNAEPAKIVRNHDAHRTHSRSLIHPSMILLKPKQLMDRPPKWKQHGIPSVPRPPKKQQRLMAFADTATID